MNRDEWIGLSIQMKETWEEIKQKITKIMKELSDALTKVEEVIYREEQEWHLILDTRLKSQVLDNKPRNLVKRVSM